MQKYFLRSFLYVNLSVKYLTGEFLVGTDRTPAVLVKLNSSF